MLAWTDEDRRQRRLFTASVGAGGETPTIELHPVLDVPGPVGGIEQVLGGPIPVVLSEGSGRARAHAFDRDGELRPFSPEDVDVTWLAFPEDGASGSPATALVSDPNKPHERALWRLFPAGAPHAALPADGMFIANPTLSRDGSTVLFLGSTLGTVEDLYAMPTDGSSAPRRLTSTAPDPKNLPGPEVPLRVVRYESLDGTPVWATLYEPPPGTPKNGAAVVFLHGAGYLQQVRASTGFPNYTVNHHFHRRLAAQGYVVFAPDFRGSAGYGRKFRADVYQKLGLPDSEDIVAGKRWLVANCGIDPDRIGLYGGSYGGFLTLMCMLRFPREFAAGAALRPVTDWRTYQPEYTRPLFGGGPAEVPDAYRLCSPIDQADKLERPLLLCHGLLDDNVFVQDTIRFVEKLQSLGKTQLFELMVYPSQNHGFTAPYAWIDEYQRIEDFFAKNLLGSKKSG